MTMFELLPEGGTATIDDAEALWWPAGPGSTPTVITDTGAWLGSLGDVPIAAADLVRIATGAYMADRRSSRGQTFSRTIDLHVQLIASEPFRDVVDSIADLLFWLTGDAWKLTLSDDGLTRPAPSDDAPTPVSAVALLSGGLDSFCGAMLAGATDRLFLGHWDSPTIKGAQNRAKSWLDDAMDGDVEYLQLRIVQAETRRESSSRSRALLFMALATAVAEARGAAVVEIPENGYTSLNPPLGPERGGALSTRSTHPSTIARFNLLLASLGLAVRLSDPYAAITKGQLVTMAADLGVANFEAGVASTLSCGKLDGGRYKGGNPNHHCGLCFPCIVRRGAIAVAGVQDDTPYLSDTLTRDALTKLRSNRRTDVAAVRRALESGFSDEVLMAMGPFPIGYDLDAAMDLCVAGLVELSHVDLG
jgi:7-cyano-7-deazaguanine synthase in queuosine biosynthesis